MRRDSRLSRMLHVLLHMARHNEPATSEAIAPMLSANPVVVRRTRAGLREAGYVHSEKGHGGGWTLTCELADISLLDIYTALGNPTIFAIGEAVDHPDCLIEQAVNGALNEVLQESRALLMAKFAAISLADLAREFDRGFADGRCTSMADIDPAQSSISVNRIPI
jgi:DNA-binding IscR family transcriptional regulator